MRTALLLGVGMLMVGAGQAMGGGSVVPVGSDLYATPKNP